MKVELINKTPNILDVIYTAARTCYNPGSPIDMWKEINNIPKEKKLKLVKGVIKSGHHSVVEHAYITFAIEGISRAASLQLVRHRHCSFSQQSQRYVEIKEDYDYINSLISDISDGRDDDNKKRKELFDICYNYFTGVGLDTYYSYALCLKEYLYRIKQGQKPEDARQILPNATRTNMVVSTNLRELFLICGLRLCINAQREIRTLIKEMRDLVVEQEPWLDEFLQPKCVQVGGICNERNSCGRFPKLEELKKEIKDEEE